MTKAIKVKLVRSVCGRIPKQRETVLGLGLTRTGDERVLEDTPSVRGMVAKVSHLVSITEEGLSMAPGGKR